MTETDLPPACPLQEAPEATTSPLATLLLSAVLLLCQFAYAIDQAVGAKVAYVVALVLLTVVALSQGRFSRKLAMAAGLAAIILLQVLFQSASGVEFGSGWGSALVVYTVFPVLVLAIDVGRIDFSRILWVLAISVIPSFLGLVLQLADAAPAVFQPDLTSTAGEVIVRYNSVYGSSLLFGMSGFVQLVSAWMLMAEERHGLRWPILGTLVLLALVCVGFSYARRAYFTIAVAGLFTVGVRSGALRFTFRRFLAVLLVTLGIGALVMRDESIVNRIVSSIDFTEDEGNVLRVQKWLLALALIESRPVLGSGPGVLSAVGKSKEEIGSAEEAEVAEMLYLTILTDLGVVLGGVVCVLFALFSMDRLRRSAFQRLVTGPLVLEGIVGTAVFSPFLLVFFLLALSESRESPIEGGDPVLPMITQGA